MKPSTLALTLGASIRLTRLVIADQLGEWLIHEPIRRRQFDYLDDLVDRPLETRTFEETVDEMWAGSRYMPTWWKVSEMRECEWCVGYWIGTGVLASAVLFGERKAWRFVAGSLALNVATNSVAHLPALDLYSRNQEPDEEPED